MVKELKFLFCGLANAGKTSILRTLDNNFEKISTLTPTSGVNYNLFKVMGFTVAVWDMGGQFKYRKKYLVEREWYFQETSACFYVIDVQDTKVQKESLNYLEDLRDAIGPSTEDGASFTIMLHKFDPHIRGKNDKIAHEIDTLTQRISKILAKYNHNFFKTTIYEPHTVFRAFSQTLLNYVPQAEIIWSNIEEIARDFGSPMSILLDMEDIFMDNGTRPMFNSLISRNLPGSPEFARLMGPDTNSEFTLLNLNDLSNIAVVMFPVGVEIFLFCILFLVRGWNRKRECRKNL